MAILMFLAGLLAPPDGVTQMAALEAEVFGAAPITEVQGLEPPVEAMWLGTEEALMDRAPAPARPGAMGDMPPWRAHSLPWRSAGVPRLAGFTLPVVLNARVAQYIDLFTGRGRSIYAQWYARMGRYHRMITATLEEEGLPTELIYVAMIESGFQPDAVSRAAAVGPWQFIESTGRSFQLRVDDWVDERRDPVKATRAAARYLKRLYDRFESWPLALAAYNAGPGNVRAAMKRANTNDYWRLCELGELPQEAMRYVPRILAAMIIGRNAAMFGLADVPARPAEATAMVLTPGGLDLHDIAKAVPGLKAKALLDANPELRRGFTPPYGADYPLKVPRAHAPLVEAALAKGEQARPRVYEEYTLRFGERMRDVARDHGISRGLVRRVNGIPWPQEPEAGQVLLVPRGKKGPVEGTDDLLVYVDPPLDFDPGDRQTVYFPVRRPLTVAQVAEAFRVPAADLALWNGLDPAARVQHGLVLRAFVPKGMDLSHVITVPAARVTRVEAGTEAEEVAREQVAAPRPEGTRQIEHKVAKGDSLWDLSQKYAVSVEAIRAENGMGPKGGIRIGDVVRIPARKAPKPRGKAKKRKAKRGARTYTVKPGDSLWEIGEKFGVSPADIQKKNNVTPARLRPGMELIIPK